MDRYQREHVYADRSAWVVVIVCVSLLGCGGAAEYRRTGHVYAPRGPLCDYEVVRNRTIEPYEEVGTIDVAAFSAGQLPNDEEKFRKVVSEYVCQAGGDAVIPGINLYGRWVIGTVIRFDPPQCTQCDDKGMKEAAVEDDSGEDG
ncbi:MAG: hypothetical protein AAGF92_05885 [Myxococcota bacterium]